MTNVMIDDFFEHFINQLEVLNKNDLGEKHG